MPFNRDLIESGCALKTFDGDLSVLEKAIDFTLTKSAIPQQQNKAVVVSPLSKQLSTVASCVPREKRHIKEVVYGHLLDELPSTSHQGVQAVSHPVSKQVISTPAVATGFCFRHIVEDSQHTVESTVTHPPVSPQKSEATLNAGVTRTTDAACVPSGKRHIKDVVYGDKLNALPSTPMQEVQSAGSPASKPVVEIPAAPTRFRHPHTLKQFYMHELQ